MPRKAKTANPSTSQLTSQSIQSIQLALPEEFLALCQRDGVPPELVLRGFIADLCELMSWTSQPRTDGYCSNGSDERSYARAYYERVGYPWWNQG